MNQTGTAFRGFLVALLATAFIVVVHRLVFVQLLEMRSPFMPFLISVLVAAWMSGMKVGLFATALGAVVGIYLSSEHPSFHFSRVDFQVELLLFVLSGGLLSWIVTTRQVARRRVEDRQRELEQEVIERRKAEASEREHRERLTEEMRRREEAEMELREREERIRLAVESANIGTWDLNPLTGERIWSDRCKAIFGLPPDADVNDVPFVDRLHRRMQEALNPNGAGNYEIEYRLFRPDGTVRWVIAKGQTLFEGEKPNRRASRCIGTAFDITERRQAEERLRASESRLQAIMNNTSAIIYLKDWQGRYLMINRRYEELFNITQQQIVGKTDADVFPSDVAAKLQANDQKVRETGQPSEFEEVVPQSDGPHTYVSVKFPIFNRAGHCNAVGGVSTDISDRKRAADVLTAEQEVLRHTIELQDHERQLLAYEIHDGIVQFATGALMQLESMEDDVKSDAIAEQIENVVGILRRTVKEGRRIINGMHATVLDDCGVVAAVKQLIEDEARAHVQVEFTKDEDLGRMAPEIEVALYRITQEALTNFYKHSHGNKVRVELRRRGDRVHLQVRDWGVGFTPPADAKGVHGLRGMTERARIAGGQCTIENAHGGGTQVIVDLPYLSRN